MITATYATNNSHSRQGTKEKRGEMLVGNTRPKHRLHGVFDRLPTSLRGIPPDEERYVRLACGNASTGRANYLDSVEDEGKAACVDGCGTDEH